MTAQFVTEDSRHASLLRGEEDVPEMEVVAAVGDDCRVIDAMEGGGEDVVVGGVGAGK